MLHRNLWAPWRLAYLRQIVQEQQTLTPGVPGVEPGPVRAERDEACFLCAAATVTGPGHEARERLVLLADQRGMVMLNRYPYTNGHLLVAPRQHVASLEELDTEARHGLIDLTAQCEGLLRATMQCQGINVGINLGRCAGAGLPGHLHVHLVPRWEGDTNFMQTTAGLRIIPQALEDSYDQLTEMLMRMSDQR